MGDFGLCKAIYQDLNRAIDKENRVILYYFIRFVKIDSRFLKLVLMEASVLRRGYQARQFKIVLCFCTSYIV